jgi:cytochrome c-type biogenesis protein CcmH/NrfG
MSSQSQPGSRTVEPAEVRRELLRRLGLPADATERDIEAAHRAAVAVLEHAPDDQRAWAREQLSEVEAVWRLLSETDAEPAAVAEPMVLDGDDAPPVITAPRRRSKVAWVAAGLVLLVGAAFGVHTMSNASSVPGITGTPDVSSSASAPALDMAKVSDLMQKITSNPKDVASFAALASLYFKAGDYKNSSQFSSEVVKLDPRNATGWVGLGAAQFNLGDSKAAEKSWLKAVAVAPRNAEAHYDLGFLYLSSATPDLAKVKAEWQKVIAIDPTSDIAKNVQTHLKSLSSQSPAPVSSSGK